MNRNYIFNTPNYFDINYKDDKKRGMVLIVPGGGYDHTSLREGDSVSNAFLNEGYHTCIIRYRETLDVAPMPMKELMYTVDFLKKDKLVDSNKIILIGFSAGSHMVANLSNHYMEYPEYDCRPSLDILCYPVITSDPKYSHKGSFEYLIGKENMTPENISYADIAKNVHKDFPPTFMWHTATDESVPFENSLIMCKALKDNKIKFEYHVFPEGCHGLSMATQESAMGDERKIVPYVQRWFKMAIEFINEVLK